MLRKSSHVRLSLLFISISLSLFALVSCGGGGGGGNTQLTDTQKAAASASAAQGAISLSSNVGQAAGMAKSYIPAGYAPGKSGILKSTADIANIDPRLKDVVDKMLVRLRKTAVQGPLAKAGSFKTIPAPLSATSNTITVTCGAGPGYYVISSSITTSLTSTTNTVTVTYSDCRDTASLSVMNGSLSATHTIDSVGPSDSANVTINILTDTAYTDATFAVVSDIFSLNGVFTSTSNNNDADGLNTALGLFRWTSVNVSGNIVMAFNFGSGSMPVTDSWTRSILAGTTTELHTANGAYSLSISSPGAQPMTLGITLTNLADKVATNTSGDTDVWINGSISIGWTPDLSSRGCLNGAYVFTTGAATPVHTAWIDFCPSSGKIQVNNGIIEFGKPSGTKVTVSLIGGPSEVFPDCTYLGGDTCSM